MKFNLKKHNEEMEKVETTENTTENTAENTVKLSGFARIKVLKADGTVKEDTGWLKNTITTASLAVISGLAGNTGSQTAFTFLAVGTSATAESAGHTALQAEITDTGFARIGATVSRTTTTQTNDTLQLDYTWTATGTKVIEEIGIFNNAVTGTMLGRKLTGSKTVNNTERLIATYKVVFS